MARDIEKREGAHIADALHVDGEVVEELDELVDARPQPEEEDERSEEGRDELLDDVALRCGGRKT